MRDPGGLDRGTAVEDSLEADHAKRTPMRKQIIRISILQSSKIMTALYVLLGFIYSLIGIPMLVLGNTQIRIMGLIYLFMPLFLGIFGFIFFVVFAAVYNLLARVLGGFEVEVRDTDEAFSPPSA